jgi:hypothetical protein
VHRRLQKVRKSQCGTQIHARRDHGSVDQYDAATGVALTSSPPLPAGMGGEDLKVSCVVVLKN